MEEKKGITLNIGGEGLIEDVLTKEELDRLTPSDVIALLKAGNQRFVQGAITLRNHREQVRKAVKGQYPKAIVLSCIDSRVPVEDVFDRGIGDLFVARIAGNFVNEDILGSMEFACHVTGSKLVLVLGHKHCGAIKSVIDDVKLGNITRMLAKLKPALEASSGYDGEKSSTNEDFVQRVTEQNVLLTINQIRKESPILAEMEQKDQIKIIGGIYDMDTGKVDFLEDVT
ncbi:carbonic anhydrase family protein [Pontibacter sp. SGAir0037]|uniref:carbonic anhydrase family protein n=1 Tax=Pontibacter sp. SGAir0037 TaxID=2571030 RepID=UPI0010CCD6ED|nr:carbonic anhydrase family protein [Pontibacter sp. SGAir0037]QCR21599.1 carbonic anhydrase [Pontibacter sp. SGAir0037]